MNIRNAILTAADHIESNPKEFSFGSVVIPSGRSCGTPGCALGWIGHFLGVEAEAGYTPLSELLVPQAIGIANESWICAAKVFYARLVALCGSDDWQNRADLCASAMRLYADKYHPAPKLGIPDSVRAIFEIEQTAESI